MDLTALGPDSSDGMDPKTLDSEAMEDANSGELNVSLPGTDVVDLRESKS